MSTIARLTLEQYERMIEAGVFDPNEPQRIELIHGELREIRPTGSPHQFALNFLANEWGRKFPAGIWVQVQAPIVLVNQQSMPEPDLALIARQETSNRRPHVGDVFLLIEIAESSLE